MAYAAAMSTPEPQADRPKTTRPVRRRGRAPSAPTLRLTLRLDVGGHATLGPGKARLLELIGETGSISAAGRAMGMSYRRAWMLVDALNQTFREPVVETRGGGVGGGGATLTAFGASLVADYRAMEEDARVALSRRLAKLEDALAPEAMERVAEPQ